MTYTSWRNTLGFTEPTDILITDPCYIITHKIPELDKIWGEICNEWFPEPNKPGDNHSKGTITINDTWLLYTSTAYGDGTYQVSSHHDKMETDDGISVDSGTMCVVKLEDALKLNPKLCTDLGVIIRGFKGEITATGKGFSGDLVVHTDDCEEENEDD